MAEAKKIEHKSLWEALAAFQAELPHVGKDATNPHFKSAYATLEDMSKVVMPLLAKHGMAFAASTSYDDGDRLVLNATLAHVSGETLGGAFPVVGQNAQQLGSSITYARRYLLGAMTGVAPGGEDDDGNAAAQAGVPKKSVPKPPAEWRKKIAEAQTESALNEMYDVANQQGWATDEVIQALTARKNQINANT